MALTTHRMRLVGALAAVLGLAALSGCESAGDRAAAHYERGQRLMAEGEPAKASLEFRNALRLKEDMTEAALALGQLEESQGHLDGAVQLYVSVAERDPEEVRSRVRLAYLLLGANQLDDAARFADEAYAITKADPSILVAKAAIALKRGDREDAARLSKAVLEIDPDNTDAVVVLATERLLSADPKGALALLSRSLEQNERSLDLQFLKLTALKSLDDSAAMESVLIRLTEIYPEMPTLRDSLADWYVSEGRNADAEAVLRRFADTNPDDVSAHLKLVSFIAAQRGAPAAVEELKALIARNDVFAYRFAMSQLAFGEGRHGDAFALMTRLADEAEDDADRSRARIELARMKARVKDWAEAERLADMVLETDAKNVDALGIRASARLASGQDTAAIADLTAALNEAPDSVPLLSMIGEAYARAGSVELAEEQYIRVLRLDQHAPQQVLQAARFLLRYGKVEQTERILDEARERAPEDRSVLTLLGQLRLAQHDWQGATEVANALRSLGDTDATIDAADSILAAALGGMGKYQESIDLLETRAQPAYHAVLEDLVRAYLRAGKVEDAEALLASVIAAEPGSTRARLLLGTLYGSTGRAALAESTLADAVAAAPEDVTTYTALARHYYASGRLEDAESTARDGLAKDEGDSALQLLLALSLEGSGRYEEAIALYEEMFAADPQSTMVANNLASLLSEHRSDAESLDRAFTIALRFRTSEIPQFLDTLGWIYYLRGEYAPSLALLKTAAEGLPDNGSVQYHLGMALKQLGQNDLAAATLKNAILLSATLTPDRLEGARSALEQLTRAESTAKPS